MLAGHWPAMETTSELNANGCFILLIFFTNVALSSAMEVRERKEKSGRTRPRREKKGEEEDSGDETPDPDEVDEANVTRQRLNKDANLRGSAR